MDQLDCEINSATVFRQQASELSTVNNLEETLNKFGFAKDDRIERREMVLMYSAVEKEMEKEISRLAYDTKFDEAKEARERLTRLRNEFCDLQTNATKTLLKDQTAYFEKANSLLLKNLKAKHNEDINTMTATLTNARTSEQKLHDIQRENLETQIRRIPPPRVKYSKRMIELFKAESG